MTSSCFAADDTRQGRSDSSEWNKGSGIKSASLLLAVYAKWFLAASGSLRRRGGSSQSIIPPGPVLLEKQDGSNLAGGSLDRNRNLCRGKSKRFRRRTGTRVAHVVSPAATFLASLFPFIQSLFSPKWTLQPLQITKKSRQQSKNGTGGAAAFHLHYLG